MINAKYLLPHSMLITGLSFTMNRSLCHIACCSESNRVDYIDFMPLQQNINTSLITHIYIHEYQFMHVDDTQNYRNNTLYEFMQSEQN